MDLLEVTLTPAEAERLLNIAPDYPISIRGVRWMRIQGEFPCDDDFKASPHGRHNPDKDCEWWDRETIQEIAEQVGGC